MRSASPSQDTPAILSSPATRLPQDIVDMIIAHLIYDTRSLRACSLTCYSWYIASVPHLHHTLTTRPRRWYGTRGWPEPLQDASELGLLPLVKKFKHYGTDHMNPGFSPKRFNRRLLRQFSALTNVQELAIDDLDIPGSMPMLQRYFGHFLPTVRSLALKGPFGSRRQILYFVGLFEHLEDLTLIVGTYDSGKGEQADDLTLVPPFAPPLRGRLAIHSFAMVGLLEDMIRLFGGIRFRHMHLIDVDETPLLLGACAGTLETLRLHLGDYHREYLYPKGMRVPANNLTGTPPLIDFDLSRNTSLRTLELKARSVVHRFGCCTPDRATLSFLVATLSTITSPTFSDVIVFYRDIDFDGLEFDVLNPYREITPEESAREESWHRGLFDVFREMHTVRDFRLTLCAEVWDCVGEYAVQVLKRAVAVEKAANRLDYFSSEPMVVLSPRGSMR
jgi:hypothetical protein